jgi:hypothetical protein
MSFKLSDLRSDSWTQITRTIAEGREPSVNDLGRAFGRAEPVVLAPEVQKYLKRLLIGPKKKGRPRKDPLVAKWDREWQARYLVMQIDDLCRAYKNRSNPKTTAFATIAQERRVSPESIERQYRRANKLLGHHRRRSERP